MYPCTYILNHLNVIEDKLVHVSGSVRGTKCGLDVGTCIEKRDGGTFQTSTLNQSKEGYQTEGQV